MAKKRMGLNKPGRPFGSALIEKLWLMPKEPSTGHIISWGPTGLKFAVN
jgi:hypothetical protein